jgi:protein-tyrosine phosphatase
MDNHPSKILDWLYLGTYNNASNLNELELYDIKYVLNCANECVALFPYEISYINLKLTDQLNSDLFVHFDDAFYFLDQVNRNGGKVLVHCQLGKSRSVAMVIAYLIRSQRMSYEDAYKFVKSKRKVALPNIGFIKQLRDLEKQIGADFDCSTKSFK